MIYIGLVEIGMWMEQELIRLIWKKEGYHPILMNLIE